MRLVLPLAAMAAMACSGPVEPPPDPPGDVPTAPAELFDWLERGEYRGYARESAAHPSAGPHPVEVLTYLNAPLDSSVRAGRARHPIGATAVKELFRDGTLRGWAVMIKVREDRTDGRAWYWYEVTGRDPGRRTDPDFAGVGLGSCTGCHSSGSDFLRTPIPLR
ncbi:MAG: hypothetical protein AB7L66_16005 [Gemmatimonadales bacterium]